MEDFWQWLPLIVVLALLLGAFTEWLSFKTKQRELGTSAGELEEGLARLREDFERREAALQERIRNLETIVTSQAWDQLTAEAHIPEPKRLAPERRVEPDEPSDAGKAETLARRLRT